jgi:hypothetical protein
MSEQVEKLQVKSSKMFQIPGLQTIFMRLLEAASCGKNHETSIKPYYCQSLKGDPVKEATFADHGRFDPEWNDFSPNPDLDAPERRAGAD